MIHKAHCTYSQDFQTPSYLKLKATVQFDMEGTFGRSGLYDRYKKNTVIFVLWLVQAARSCGYVVRSGESLLVCMAWMLMLI